MVIPTRDDRHQAEETLSYIRQTMETASTYTAVSGWGLVAVGGIGVVSAWLARASGQPAPLSVWVPAALISLAAAGTANAIKAKQIDVPLWSGSFRKVVWGLAPALIAGAFLTWALTRQGTTAIVPGMWLSVYGAGVAAGGMFSVRALRWMGVFMLALGGLALVQPQYGLLLLAAGFGGGHLVFGSYIVHRHGG